MKKSHVIGILLLCVFTTIIIYFQNNIVEFMNEKYAGTFLFDEYKYGEASGIYGNIKIKLKTNADGGVKELYIIDYNDSYPNSVKALQKLANNSKNRKNADDIDVISGATVTSEVYKEALNNALGYKKEEIDEKNEKNSLMVNESIINKVERKTKAIDDGYMTGLGVIIQNNLSDADNSKNGEMVINEYMCGVLLQKNGRIMDVKFDHLISNMMFNNKGEIPTGTVRKYEFLPDSKKADFIGISLEENYIDMLEFENECIKLMYLKDVEKYYGEKKAYEPYIHALNVAFENARFIGAKKGDTIGISSKKILNKKDILDAKSNKNGNVIFNTLYTLISMDMEAKITSCIIDSSTNSIGITSDGKILKGKNSQIHTIVDLSNTKKYSKIDELVVDKRVEYNNFSDAIVGNTMNDIVLYLSENTDNNGRWTNKNENYVHIDFLTLVNILTDAYLQARAI